MINKFESSRWICSGSGLEQDVEGVIRLSCDRLVDEEGLYNKEDTMIIEEHLNLAKVSSLIFRSKKNLNKARG